VIYLGINIDFSTIAKSMFFNSKFLTMAEPKHTVTLYRRQRQIIDFIAQFTQRKGYSPNLRDIADAMGLTSLATVHEHINRLVKKGVVKKTMAGGTRGIVLVDDKFSETVRAVNIPVLGWFTQGKPIDPFSDSNVYVQVGSDMVPGSKRAFALKIKDSTLKDEAILDGDYLLIEENAVIKDGDVVVAILEDSTAIIKKIFRESTRVRLESLTSNFAPFYTTKVAIQGRVLSLVRKYIQL